MPEQEFNAIFSRRLRHYLNLNGITQAELAKRLGVGTTSVYNWCNGIKTPRMDKVDAMCELFHCRRSDLILDNQQEETRISYLLRKLNDAGKREATKRVEELTYIPAYTIAPSASSADKTEPLLTAAHARTDVEVTEEGIQNDLALMDDDDNWT